MARLRTLPEALAEAARADAGYLFLSADGGGAAPDAASGTYRSYADMQRLSWQVARASCPDLALVLSREDFDGDAPEPAAPPSLDDIVLVQFTSGSTSRPKGVALSHRNLAANVDAINGPAGLATTDADIGVSWLPLNHDMGLIGMALGPLFSARRGVLLPPHVFVKRPGEW